MKNCLLPATPVGPPGFQRPDYLSFALIILCWVAMALLSQPIGDFPLNDDWVYGLAVKSLVETGQYQFPSPTSANVGPQIYWGALFCLPFGFSYTALRMSTLVVGLLGVLALYCLIRRFSPDYRVALTGSTMLAVNPLYFGLANSFMTDVPFMAVLLVAMYYLIRGFQNDSSRDLAIGIALGFVLVLIRQLALVLFVGMALAYPVKYGVTARNIGKVILLNAAGLLLHVLYQYWLIHTGRMPMLLAHSDLNYLLNISNRGWYMRNVTLGTISYIGFLCLPLVALLLQSRSSGVWHWQSGRINLAFVVPAILLAGLVGWKGGMMPSMTNVLTSYGLGPMTLRDTYLLSTNLPFIPETATLLWGMTTALSILAGAIILCHVCALAKRALADLASPSTRPATWLFWMLAAMALSYFLILLLISGTLTVFERYFLVFVPVVVLLLVNRMRDDGASVRPQAFIVPTVLILAYAGFSVAATRDYLEWNRMRWQASNTLMTDKKITPAEIDGGYEFNGLYLYDPGYVQKKGKSWWWVVGDQYVIASGPLTGYSELKRYPFKRWLLQSEDQVLVLRKD